MKIHYPLIAILAATLRFGSFAATDDPIPANFPQFKIADHTTQSQALRHLFHQHYNTAPRATLWDEWLLPPAIWPASGAREAAQRWRTTLSNRPIEADGYVATNQHHSIAHQLGWPFPFWGQSSHNFGWHFSFKDTVGPGWRPNDLASPDDWEISGAESLGLQDEGLVLQITSSTTILQPPPIKADSHEAPFIQLRWRADHLPATATPYLEWTTDSATDFSPVRRFYFAPPAPGRITYTMVPVYRHPAWIGNITGLRLNITDAAATGTISVQALFGQYDTRHDINNPSYVTACVDYFLWTGDLNFLRDNIEKMRLAMRYMETEFGTDKDGIVTVPWVGHEGISGVQRNADGSARILSGQGVGNNYWDLLPFGKQDAYATIRHYSTALKMARLEDAIASHPGWNIPPSPLARSGEHWRQQAALSKSNGNRLFFNTETARFTLGIDANGEQADFGYTFLNLEAIYYDFATPEHARSIMDWIDGHRTVATDTSQTSDIYHWRFAPRASTLRNISHYGWFWTSPESIPYGNQVQDGGAVLGFSYHDIMARLKVNGPDDAAQRLMAILDWYDEVTKAGGYRAYYDGKTRDGTLQGGGPPGGLGMDKEFFESVLVPQVILEGFLGFYPTIDGFAVSPRLPVNWPTLTIDNITCRGATFSIRATPDTITIVPQETGALSLDNSINISVAKGWNLTSETEKSDKIRWDGCTSIVLDRM